MASFVLSERAFSSAGITICKRHNCLDTDIVEALPWALQCLKSLIHQDLMVHLMVQDVVSIADEEHDLDYVDEQPANQDSTPIKVVDAGDDFSWGVVSDDGDGVAEDTEIELVEYLLVHCRMHG